MDKKEKMAKLVGELWDSEEMWESLDRLNDGEKEFWEHLKVVTEVFRAESFSILHDGKETFKKDLTY